MTIVRRCDVVADLADGLEVSDIEAEILVDRLFVRSRPDEELVADEAESDDEVGIHLDKAP